MIKAQKCFNLGWLGGKNITSQERGGKELQFVLAMIVSSIGKRLWLISSGQREQRIWMESTTWPFSSNFNECFFCTARDPDEEKKSTRLKRKNWLSSMAFLKILKAQEGILRNTWSAEVKNSFSKDSEKCRGRCASEWSWGAKNDHNLDKCQHKGKEAAERRLLHVANRDEAQW